MNPVFRNFWVFCLLLATMVAGIASFSLFTNKSLAWPILLNPDPMHANDGSRSGLKGFGIIDLEHGIGSLAFLQSGRLKKILVTEGQRVTPDQILMEQDDQAAIHRYQEAELALAAAKIQLEMSQMKARTYPEQLTQQKEAELAMQARVDSAKSLLSRKEELQRINQASNFEVDMASQQVNENTHLLRAERAKRNELKIMDPRPQILNSEIQVDLMNVRLKQAQDGWNECKLKSPSSGTILRILTAPGNLTGGPNQPPAIQFISDEDRIIRVEIEQEFVSRVKNGQAVEVQNETDPSEKWIGKVYHIADWVSQRRQNLLDPTSQHDVRTVEVLIRLNSDRISPRLGMAVMVSFGSNP